MRERSGSRMKPGKVRLDDLLVMRGSADSKSKARALILAGEVRLPGRPSARPTPGMQVSAEEELVLVEKPRFVSRGGEKLAHALDRFGVDPAGKTALDVGASTGGFTDCLLQRGARRVYAVDVGYGQLDDSLRRDERVVVMERVNARHDYELPEAVDLVVADVSFISLRLIVPVALRHLSPGGVAVVLLKPQFEAERGEVGRGGIVRDPQLHARIIGRFVAWAVASGVRVRDLASSPILGDKGNREFFLKLDPQRATGTGGNLPV
ncbi:MAG: TlyA family RNA methyltransferase [SAR202 cluster bacterium]|nr:TlyA family RNA methyltransferase [SAR202 cluster bacterium]